MDVTGGYAFYGQTVGVLLLDARYPRLPGDVGHAATYRMPVQFEVVPGLSAERLIHHFEPGMIDDVADAIDRLAHRGASVVVAGCGFFARMHGAIRERSSIPFLSSSLLQVPWLLTLYGAAVGVLTIDEQSLDDAYLKDCGWSRGDERIPVQGVARDSLFYQVYFQNRLHFDPAVMQQDVVEAALTLHRERPDLRALVLECTNMAPFAHAVQTATSLPVYDIQGLAHFVAGAASRHPYHG